MIFLPVWQSAVCMMESASWETLLENDRLVKRRIPHVSSLDDESEIENRGGYSGRLMV